MLEKSDTFGGTIAMSGGMLWIPLNHHMVERGIDDDRDEALCYLRAVTDGRAGDTMLETLVDFGRGETAYERYWGDLLAPHPNLAPLEQPPFYAAEVLSGVIGTNSGVGTTPSGQAVDAFGKPVPGLYALGNTRRRTRWNQAA